MRKVDRIKQLEAELRKAINEHMQSLYELGRYTKAVADRDKEIAALRAEYQGYREIQLALDGIICYLVGEIAEGGRLEIPVERILASVGKYRVNADKSPDGRTYDLRVVEMDPEGGQE